MPSSTCLKLVFLKGDFLKYFASQVHITKKKYQSAMLGRGNAAGKTTSIRHHAKTWVVAGDGVDHQGVFTRKVRHSLFIQ